MLRTLRWRVTHKKRMFWTSHATRFSWQHQSFIVCFFHCFHGRQRPNGLISEYLILSNKDEHTDSDGVGYLLWQGAPPGSCKGMHPSTDKQPRMFASFFLICSQLPEISPKNRKTNVKMAQKGLKKASKRGQSYSKTTPTLCQNDAKTMPNDPWVTPKWPGIDPKTVQNHTKMVPFRSQNSPKNGPDRVKNGTEKLTKGQK